jgi:hypothetical protein
LCSQAMASFGRSTAFVHPIPNEEEVKRYYDNQGIHRFYGTHEPTVGRALRLTTNRVRGLNYHRRLQKQELHANALLDCTNSICYALILRSVVPRIITRCDSARSHRCLSLQ